MSKRPVESPFQALEEEAYHAFREWPVWLTLRLRELDAHLTAQRPPEAAPPDARTAQPDRDSALAD